MTLQIYAIFVKGSEGKPRVGVLLAEDQKQALAKAVDHCKASFGPASRVTLVSHVAEANIPRLYRTRAGEILHEYDQMVFAATQLTEVTAKTIEMMESVHRYVVAMKEEIDKQQSKEDEQ